MNLTEVTNTIGQFQREYSAIKQKGQELIQALNKEFTSDPMNKLISAVSAEEFMLTFKFLGKELFAQTVILPEKPIRLKSEGALITYTKTHLGNIDKIYFTCSFDRPGNYLVGDHPYLLEEFSFVYFMKLYTSVRLHIVANNSDNEFIPLSAI